MEKSGVVRRAGSAGSGRRSLKIPSVKKSLGRIRISSARSSGEVVAGFDESPCHSEYSASTTSLFSMDPAQEEQMKQMEREVKHGAEVQKAQAEQLKRLAKDLEEVRTMYGTQVKQLHKVGAQEVKRVDVLLVVVLICVVGIAISLGMKVDHCDHISIGLAMVVVVAVAAYEIFRKTNLYRAAQEENAELRAKLTRSSSNPSKLSAVLEEVGPESTSTSTVKPAQLYVKKGPCENVPAAVNPETGLEHHHYLNFFDGVDCKLESCKHYQEMNAEQVEIFQKFRRDFKNAFASCDKFDRTIPFTTPSDFSILRFLQADKYDTKLATKRLMDTVAWRQTYNLPSLTAGPPEKLDMYQKLRVRHFMGFARNGMPVFAERNGHFIGALNSSEAKSLTQKDYLDCYLYTMAEFIAKFRVQAKNGAPIWKQLFVCDLKGIKFYPAIKSLTLLKAMAKEIEVHFPEMAGPIFLINVPSVITSVWKMAKQFLDPVVISKIQIHSGVPTDVLLEYMDESVLFEEYGGKNKAPYPKFTL